MNILGIETSCDETGFAVYQMGRGLLAHTLHSQIETHAQYGGVVPELASRNHMEYLVPLLDQTLHEAKMSLNDINAVAYTAGPGLVGALLTGACFAKSLAYALSIPTVGIHHLEAHILAALLDDPQLTFPFIALLVSGGHTMLINAKGLGDYELMGETLDDAVGEAFDKTAKLMGISYPGGPKLAALADQYPVQKPLPFAAFPCPMINRPNFNFSFSGLKTHALLTWQKSAKDEEAKKSIAFAFQEAIIETLSKKCERALKFSQYKTLVVAGGVGANLKLRTQLNILVQSLNATVHFPALAFCTDNGAMIAYAGAHYFKQQQMDVNYKINVKARWPLSHLKSS